MTREEAQKLIENTALFECERTEPKNKDYACEKLTFARMETKVDFKTRPDFVVRKGFENDFKITAKLPKKTFAHDRLFYSSGTFNIIEKKFSCAAEREWLKSERNEYKSLIETEDDRTFFREVGTRFAAQNISGKLLKKVNKMLAKFKTDAELQEERKRVEAAERAKREEKARREKEAEERRVKAEAQAARTAKQKKTFKLKKTLKTVAYFLPVILSVIIGCDVFNPVNGYQYRVRTMPRLSWGGVITLYVFLCIITVFCAVFLTARMCVKEYVRRDYVCTHTRYSVFAYVMLGLTVFVCAFNLGKILPHLGQNKIIYEGGGYRAWEYVKKGESVTLAECNAEDYETEKYGMDYTFYGWEINGERYAAGDEYTPKGWDTATAIIDKYKYCNISVKSYCASVKIYAGNELLGTFTEGTIRVPYGKQIMLKASYTYDYRRALTVNGTPTASGEPFEIEEHSQIQVSSQDPTGCFVGGTLITLADGSVKAVEDLKIGDRLLVFNHETGKLDSAPLLCNIHANRSAELHKVIELRFSNGTTLKIADEHFLFDKTLNSYVRITEANASEFKGHSFVTADLKDGTGAVTLSSVTVREELTKIYNPVTVWHVNAVANGMLTYSAHMADLFEYDDDMKIDEKALSADVEKYGLFTYEDFKEYVSKEEYELFPFAYYKPAILKGEYTFEELLHILELYYGSESIQLTQRG